MSEFTDHLAEVFRAFGPIRTRRMFGGHGVYRGDVMFALVADDVLYLKTDAESAPAFVERGLAQFAYDKRSRTVRMSYYEAPEEIFDDESLARDWAATAYAAALRARKGGSSGPGA